MSIYPINTYDVYNIKNINIHIIGDSHYPINSNYEEKKHYYDQYISEYLINKLDQSNYSILLLEMFPINSKGKKDFLQNIGINIQSKNMHEIIKHVLKNYDSLGNKVFGSDYRRNFTHSFNQRTQDNKTINIQELIYEYNNIRINENMLIDFFKILFKNLHDWSKVNYLYKINNQKDISLKKIIPLLIDEIDEVISWLNTHIHNPTLHKKDYMVFINKLKRNLAIIGDFHLMLNMISTYLNMKLTNIYILIGSEHSKHFKYFLKNYLIKSYEIKDNKLPYNNEWFLI